jgi:hypothetical protein
MSAKGSRHLARVATVPCVVCLHMGLERKQAEVHHLFDTATKSDFLTRVMRRPSSGRERVSMVPGQDTQLRYKTEWNWIHWP